MSLSKKKAFIQPLHDMAEITPSVHPNGTYKFDSCVQLGCLRYRSIEKLYSSFERANYSANNFIVDELNIARPKAKNSDFPMIFLTTQRYLIRFKIDNIFLIDNEDQIKVALRCQGNH